MYHHVYVYRTRVVYSICTCTLSDLRSEDSFYYYSFLKFYFPDLFTSEHYFERVANYISAMAKLDEDFEMVQIDEGVTYDDEKEIASNPATLGFWESVMRADNPNTMPVTPEDYSAAGPLACIAASGDNFFRITERGSK